VARWIEGAARVRLDCTFAVTSRFAGYDQARLNEDFLELHIRPLTSEQTSAFIRNWYRAVETGLGADQQQAEVLATTRADELITRLSGGDFRSTRLTWMTSNPLLLSNLCLVHRDRGQLPRGRARLYEECVEVLLERWREGKGLAVDVRAEEGRRVLQPVADWLHSKEQRTRASAEELEPVVEPALIAVQWKGGGAREFLRTVRDESGLLTGWGVDEYGFMHLGFQEFLAAREIRRRHFTGDPNAFPDLAARFGQAWWQEVILLLVALKEEPSAFEPFMREVAKLPVFAEHERLLDDCREDAFDVTETPFVELASGPPTKDAALWARQLVALRQLDRMQSGALDGLRERIRTHPSPEVQRWLREKAAATAQDVLVTKPGAVELVLIPGGTFVMGSPEKEKARYADEGPQREVTVAPFHIGRYPVTNEEYSRFLDANPDVPKPEFWGNRTFNGARQPVVGVSWDEARAFAEWAGCRLPSEAEWEYAARAGTSAPYLDGATEKDLGRYAWYAKNSDQQTHAVGEKAANTWGLHDVIGNAWQWVEDDWHDSYQGAPTDGSARVGKPRAAFRVVRGGSWYSSARDCRVAFRFWGRAGERIHGLGFRVARS
jgi:formylglycine-generating enzyme required for sulfatase activity